MKKIIKILLALFTLVFTSTCFSNITYASETNTDTSDMQLLKTVNVENANSASNTDITSQTDMQWVEVKTYEIEDNVEEQGIDHQVEETTKEKTEKKEVAEKAEKKEVAEKTEKKEVAEKAGKKEVTKNNIKKEQSKKKAYSNKNLRLLSGLIYAEAGNQSYDGMLAVANVVLNRSKSSVYAHANTIKKVIYDKKWSVQFSVTIKNSKTGVSSLDKALKLYDTGNFSGSNLNTKEKCMKKAIEAAKSALQGKNNIGSYLCFTSNRNSGRIRSRYSYRIIGDHIFYRNR
jgi:spore germination cell wall hydrolase CwlJ-like protein